MKLANFALIALATGLLGACDDRWLHQDRPGGSDYQGGRYSRDSRDDDTRDRDRDREYRDGDNARATDMREWCYRHPDARECQPR
jgi:hypothetical protein